MNLKNIRIRSNVIKLIRAWFDERGFTEMHTPRLVGLPGQEPYLEPFWTGVETPTELVARRSSQDSDPKLRATSYELPAALITSPEYAMKRLLAEGMDKIYDLGSCFRNNEPFDGTHDPEFLLLEWYRRDAGLEDLMQDTEEMMKWVAEQLVARRSSQDSDPKLRATSYEPRAISKIPFRRLTVEDAFREYLNVELTPLLNDREGMAELCRSHGQTVTDGDLWDDLYFKLFLSEVEPRIAEGVPTFLYRYPASQAALARRSADDSRYADRMELYAGGLELANGFAELADEQEQRSRFLEEQELRKKLGKPTWGLDERFLSSLPKMGNAAGIAFGVDRFVMLLTGAKSINDVVPFPARERFSDTL